MPRDNDKGARSKSRDRRTIPVSAELIRLWDDYLHSEYGDLDSDHMFVALFAEARGQAWSYAALYDLVKRLRKRTGIDFDPHWARHSYATKILRDDVPIEVVSNLLGHSSVTTTSAVYGHLNAEDARSLFLWKLWRAPTFVDSHRSGTMVYEERTRNGSDTPEVHTRV